MAPDAQQARQNGLGSAADRAGEAATDAKHRAEDLAGGLRQGKGNVTGAVSGVGSGVKGAVGGAVDATAHATREMTGILFWLSMLGGLILLVFIPNREKQQELWNGTTQFLSELREMWRDLQGTALEELPASPATSSYHNAHPGPLARRARSVRSSRQRLARTPAPHCRRASASLQPTCATSGSVKLTQGTMALKPALLPGSKALRTAWNACQPAKWVNW